MCKIQLGNVNLCKYSPVALLLEEPELHGQQEHVRGPSTTLRLCVLHLGGEEHLEVGVDQLSRMAILVFAVKLDDKHNTIERHMVVK